MTASGEALAAFWRQEEQAPFRGWDHSYLEGRLAVSALPWDYAALAEALMGGARTMLDMGTGGGERLLALRHAWPARVIATEGYGPNITVAAERLRPPGAAVVGAGQGTRVALPFAPASFDLMINRHTGYRMEEVARLLRPGGRFLTQQVDALWGRDLKQAMGVAVTERPSSLALALDYLRAETDLIIERVEEDSGTLSYSDVGALVYHLKTIPWTVPGFSVDSHLPYLLALEERLERDGLLEFQTRHYLLQARKPV